MDQTIEEFPALGAAPRVLSPVPPQRRFIAWFLDSLVVGVPAWTLLFLATSLGAREDSSPTAAAGIALSLAGAFIGPIAYYVVLEGRRGQTLGKQLLGIVVVRAASGEAPTYALALGRFAARFLSAMPCGVGFAWIAVDRRRRAWHDMLTGTAVVAEDTLRRALREHAPGAAEAAVLDANFAEDAAAPDQDVPAAGQSLWLVNSIADDLLDAREFGAAVSLLVHLHASGYPRAAPRLARAATHAGNWNLALAAANDAVVTDPSDSANHAVRALALHALGSTDEGRMARANAGDRPREEMSALAELELGTPTPARAHELASRHSDSPAVVMRAAEVIRDHGGKQLAAPLLASAAMASPQVSDLVAAAIDSALGLGDRPMAADILAAGFGARPQDARLHQMAYDRFLVDARRSRWIAPLPIAILPVPTVWGFLGNLGVVGWVGALAAPAITFAVALGFGYWRESGRRRISTPALAWIDWSVALTRAVDLQRQSRPWARLMHRWHRARPPRGTIIETAAVCNCSELHAIWAELAGAYAGLHLGRLSIAPPPLDSLWACPNNLARWVLFPPGQLGPATFLRLPPDGRAHDRGYL